MRIKSIKISNVRVFPFVENFDYYNGISFEYDDKDILILIGPNGSGKSTVIEVLQTLFSKTIPRYFTKDQDRFERGQYDYYLKESSLDGKGILLSNRLTRDKEQKIEIAMHLDSNDINNIKFLVDNNDSIIKYIKKYSKICEKNDNYDQDFLKCYVEPIKDFMKEMEFPQDVKMTFISEDGKGEFKLSEIDFPLFYGYLRYFDLIENIIDIYNNEEEERKWNFLEKTFDLISSYRNYNNVNMQMDLEPDQNTDLSKNFKKQVAQNMTLTANSGEPAIFKKVLFDIFKKYAYLQKKYTEEKAKEEIENYVIFKNIKEKVNDFLKFDINIKPVSKNSIAKFRLEFSRGKEIININELSAGEKAIIHLIFAIYGSKANNGCLLIDEPEQHLHPQWQIKFREILEEEICEDRTNYQIIIATHSPSFLSIGTINNVLRFHISEDGGIDIKKPEIKEEERFFLEILKYTNCSKIFFVNKAILVEGETDNYFWNWYLEKKCKNIRDYEVYDIKGKENYEKWVDFLERWGIEVFYICDLDNIRNMSIIDDDECEKLIRGENIFKRIKNKIKKKNSLDGAVLLEALDGIIKKGFKLNKTDKRNIKDLWRYIKLRHQGVNRKMLFSFPCIKLKVYKRINNLYRKNIFILKIGELEDYTGTSKNKDKVGKVISFCNKEESLKRGQREIDFISEIILGTKELS